MRTGEGGGLSFGQDHNSHHSFEWGLVSKGNLVKGESRSLGSRSKGE